MAEEKPPSKIGSWLKAGITSVMGLCSGAVLMYVSPLVTNVVKPAKPLANFSQSVQGRTVTFQNRSSGASDGWWDFGDGSALERFSPTQDTLTHTFPGPGPYNVKLSLHNFLGDENERTVAVSLDGAPANLPAIEAFKVIPVSANALAPATFHIVSQIKNADLCIWTLGDDRPVEVSSDTSTFQERLITLKEPGNYTLRLVAVSGKQTAEKSESVFVGVGDTAAASATLQVSMQATPVQRLTKEVNLYTAFPADRKESSFPFSLTHAEGDYKIVDAKFARPVTDPAVKNPILAISPDKTRVVVTGELVKPGGIMAWQKNAAQLKWVPTLILSLEHRAQPVTKTTEPIMADLKIPGTTILPLPKLTSRWEVKGAVFNLELRDGTILVYKDSKLPISKVLSFKNHPYRVTATQGADSIRLDVTDTQATLRPIGN